MKRPLTILTNIAPRYRDSIYRLLEQHYECRWIVGRNDSDILGCDCSFMDDYHELTIVRSLKNSYRLKGGAKLALQKSSPSDILMLGEIKFLTSWVVLLNNRLRCKKHRKKVVLWSHGWLGNERGLQKIVTRFYFSLADKVLFYGEHARNLALKEGLPERKTGVIHNSLNHELFMKLRAGLESKKPLKRELLSGMFNEPDLPLFIFIGRLTKVKKLNQLLEASSLLAGQGFPNNILFIGDGEAADTLKQLAETLGIDDNVAFFGGCYDEAESAPYIYVADACVSPGNIGLTAIHSMELGTPAITHNDMVRQVPEAEIISHGVNGWLFEPDNIPSLSSAMRQAAEQAILSREKIRIKCNHSIESWTPKFQLLAVQSAFSDNQ